MYDRRHFKLTFGGNIREDIDEWTTGIRIAPSSIGTVVDWASTTQQLGVRMVPIVTAFWNAIRSSVSSGMDFRWIKLAPIGTDGKYIPGVDPYIYDLETPNSGGRGGDSSGPQASIVLSLRTNRNRGPATKGRMYLPLSGALPRGNTFKLPTSIIKTTVEAGQTFIRALELNHEGSIFAPFIMSGIGSGAINAINFVLVGDMLDTQRRRRNKFTEEYTSRPIAE